MSAGVPFRCMATQPTPHSAATGHSEAETSLTSVAPAATEAWAPAALVVAIDPPPRRGRPRLHDRDDPSQLFVGGDGLGTGSGRFAAHVDDIGPLGDHLMPYGDGSLSFEPLTAVGERVRGHIEDSHHHRALLGGGRDHEGTA